MKPVAKKKAQTRVKTKAKAKKAAAVKAAAKKPKTYKDLSLHVKFTGKQEMSAIQGIWDSLAEAATSLSGNTVVKEAKVK